MISNINKIIVFIQVPFDCVFVIIFFKTMDNKKIIRFAFCDILNNEGLGKCYQPWPWVWLITPTSTLMDITKTSLFHRWGKWQNDEQEWQNMVLIYAMC